MEKSGNMVDRLLDNRYRLLEKIGSGGMADVYKARDTVLDRMVAAKVLHSQFAEDREFVARFRHEAQAAGKLSHPHIVGIYDVGHDGDTYYIIMEYVAGETLKEYIAEHEQIPVDTAIRIALEIGSALQDAHENGIIHCDVKPHNILLTESGSVKVTDFGIARAINSSNITIRESVLGSVHYLSPEQAAGDTITEKTDMYSLGIVLYEMLTHRLPFHGNTAVSIALKHIQEDITPPSRYNPSIPPLLEEAVMTALRRDPEKRYASISEFLSALKVAQGFTGTVYRAAKANMTGTQAPVKNQKKNRRTKETEPRFMPRLLSQVSTRTIGLCAAAIFAVAFFWAYFSFGNFWSAYDISVPNVVGKSAQAAQEILEKENLRVSVDERPSDTVPVGYVIAQLPEAGKSVKEQRVIHLTVSRGGAVLSVPDLKGLSAEDAKAVLEKAGFALGAVEMGSDAKSPSGVIISQSPVAGKTGDKGMAVNIVINKKQAVVPHLIGMTLKDAKAALSEVGLSVGKLSGKSGGFDIQAETNTIFSQFPDAGNPADGVKAVDLVVERGANAKEKKGTVAITLPRDGKSRKVEIVIEDDGGKRTVYDSTAAAGATIEKDVSGTGDTVRVKVLVDSEVVQDRTL